MTGRPLADDVNTVSFSYSQPQTDRRGRNIICLLARREISPRTRCSPRWQCGGASKLNAKTSFMLGREAEKDARLGLFSWIERESLKHFSEIYCPLVPPPKSTIAAAFSSDGKTLASTHGDHTVKIIDCQTGSCLKVLSGHRRTPWVVRFHPKCPEIVASGSLDNEVRLWDANTAECIGSRSFYRAIASIAFHAEGEILAVASGHKLYIWHYNRKGESSSPVIVLKTRRSLRAVHFHPHGAPFLLTAEVNDLEFSDSSMAMATSTGCLQHPPPAIYVLHSNHLSMVAELPLMPLHVLPSITRDESRTNCPLGNRVVSSSGIEVGPTSSVQFLVDAVQQIDHMISPMDLSPPLTSNPNAATNNHSVEMESCNGDSKVEAAEARNEQLEERYRQSSSSNLNISGGADSALPFVSQLGGLPGPNQVQLDSSSSELGRDHLLLSRGLNSWELPFMQGWLMGQSQADIPTVHTPNGSMYEFSTGSVVVGSPMLTSNLPIRNAEPPRAPLAMQSSTIQSLASEQSGVRDHSSTVSLMSSLEYREEATLINARRSRSDSRPVTGRVQSEIAPSSAASASGEWPCTVKLRIWLHNMKNPSAALEAERCRLTIPHAVLCSEMGAHFSPCGKFLAACVACVLPQMEGLPSHVHQNLTGAASSPTRHPIFAQQVIYELRIYSLEEATFGSVLISRAIRAAHCLTSIQFSPTSEHILLAYGRRHGSLLKSIIVNGEASLPMYTVLEVYRVSDMELVSLLPSVEDEVNVACFHPLAGGGLVYGTKEGKLRVLQYGGGGGQGANCTVSNFCPQENMVGVETSLECQTTTR